MIVQFSESSYTVVEGDGVVSVEVVLSRSIQRKVVVGVVTEDRTDGSDVLSWSPAINAPTPCISATCTSAN